jgi:ANTAR domain/PAS fold
VATSPLQPVGTFRIALPSHAWTWSEGVFAILGIADPSVAPTTELLLQHQRPEDREAVQSFLEDVTTTGEPAAVWHRAVRPDDNVRQLVSSAAGVMAPDGTVESVAGQVVDVTEPVRLTTSRDVDDALEHLSQSRPSIDQAKGALMFAYRIDEETAFELLRVYSQHLNLKLRDLARDLTEATREPGGWSPGTRNLLDRLMRDLSHPASVENPGA